MLLLDEPICHKPYLPKVGVPRTLIGWGRHAEPLQIFGLNVISLTMNIHSKVSFLIWPSYTDPSCIDDNVSTKKVPLINDSTKGLWSMEKWVFHNFSLSSNDLLLNLTKTQSVKSALTDTSLSAVRLLSTLIVLVSIRKKKPFFLNRAKMEPIRMDQFWTDIAQLKSTAVWAPNLPAKYPNCQSIKSRRSNLFTLWRHLDDKCGNDQWFSTGVSWDSVTPVITFIDLKTYFSI